MRFFYENLIDAPVTMTPTSEAERLPVENIADALRGRPWRTGTASAGENVVIDLGSAQAVTAIILLAHTLTAGDTLIKIEGNAADSWGAPSFTQALTWSAGPIAAVFASQSFRYWRLSFTKSAAGETRDIGRVFLGTYYQTTDQPSWNGYAIDYSDLSRKLRTPSGQIYVARIATQQRLFKADFDQIPNSQADALRTLIAYVGESVSFFTQVDTNSPLTEFLYLKLSKSPKFGAQGVDETGSLAWNVTLEMEEAL